MAERVKLLKRERNARKFAIGDRIYANATFFDNPKVCLYLLDSEQQVSSRHTLGKQS